MSALTSYATSAHHFRQNDAGDSTLRSPNEAKVQTLGALWELPGALVEEWTHILEQLFK
jgi:hypothetical protein